MGPPTFIVSADAQFLFSGCVIRGRRLAEGDSLFLPSCRRRLDGVRRREEETHPLAGGRGVWAGLGWRGDDAAGVLGVGEDGLMRSVGFLVSVKLGRCAAASSRRFVAHTLRRHAVATRFVHSRPLGLQLATTSVEHEKG